MNKKIVINCLYIFCASAGLRFALAPLTPKSSVQISVNTKSELIEKTIQIIRKEILPTFK